MTTKQQEIEEALVKKMIETKIQTQTDITPIIKKEQAVYIVLKEVEGNLQIMGDTKTPDKGIAIKKADDLAIGNGTDYLVAKIISRHKKRIFTDVINYE
jgi:rRNA processing protein Krr1/Pno1